LKALDEFVLEVESKALIKFYSLCIELFWSNNNQITVIDGFFFQVGSTIVWVLRRYFFWWPVLF